MITAWLTWWKLEFFLKSHTVMTSWKDNIETFQSKMSRVFKTLLLVTALSLHGFASSSKVLLKWCSSLSFRSVSWNIMVQVVTWLKNRVSIIFIYLTEDFFIQEEFFRPDFSCKFIKSLRKAFQMNTKERVIIPNVRWRFCICTQHYNFKINCLKSIDIIFKACY
jgi:hypothetical protein